MIYKGRKLEKGWLLAIVAVVAMVMAGAAVTMSVSESDAAPPPLQIVPVPSDAVPLPASITNGTATNYYADGSVKEATLDFGTETAITVYIKSGVTVNFKGAAGNAITVTAVGYYIKDGGMFFNDPDSHVRFIKPVDGENVTVTPTCAPDNVPAKVKISGTATVTENAIATIPGSSGLGIGEFPVDKKLSVKGTEMMHNLTYAYSLFTAADGITTFHGTLPKSINHKASAEESDVLTIFGASGLEVATSIKIGTDRGSTEYKVSGLVENDLVFTAYKDSYPEVSFGSLRTVVTLASGFSYSNSTPSGAYQGIFNGVAEIGNKFFLAPQLLYVKAANPEDALAFVNVQGTVTQKSSVTIPAGLERGVYVDEGQTLIIAKDVTVTNSSASSIEGEVQLYGALINKEAGTAEFNDGSVLKIGPVGYTNYDVDHAIKSNVSSIGVQPAIGSTVYQDERLGDVVIAAPKTPGEIGLTILEGATLTIYGDLGLNHQTVRVDGTLHVTSTGSIYSTLFTPPEELESTIIIGPTGKVIIDGQMGINTIVMFLSTDLHEGVALTGVEGLDFGLVDDGQGGSDFEVSGTLVRNSLTHPEVRSSVTFASETGIMVTDALVMSEDIYALLEGIMRVTGQGSLSVEGTLTGDASVLLESGTHATFNGDLAGVEIGAYQGAITATEKGDVPNTYISLGGGCKKTGSGETAKWYETYISGLTVSVGQVKDGKDTEQRVYIDGELSVATGTELYGTPTEESPVLDIDIEIPAGRIYVGDGDRLFIPADVVLEAAASITFVPEGEIEKITDPLGYPYIGGHYVIKTTGTGAKTTHYYVPLAEALGMIDLADSKTVDASVELVESDITLLEGQTINLVLANTEISSEAAVIIGSGATQKGEAFSKIMGALVHVDGGTIVVPEEDAYASLLKKDDRTIYCGAKIAIDLSESGDTIIINNGKIDGSLTIPKDRTVIVNGTLIVAGDLTVERDAKLIINDTLLFDSGKETIHNLEVFGTLDAYGGTIAHGTKGKIAVASTGNLCIAGESAMSQFYSYDGAICETNEGYLLTDIQKAIMHALQTGVDEARVYGTVNHLGVLDIGKVKVIFTPGSVLRADDFILGRGGSIDATGGTFTGNIRTSDTPGSAQVAFSEAKGVVASCADGLPALSGVFTAGDIEVRQGTAVFSGFAMKDGATLVVEQQAVGAVTGEAVIEGGKGDIRGNIEASNGGMLRIEGGSITASGKITASKGVTGGTVDIRGRAIVIGTLENAGGEVVLRAAPSASTGLIIGVESSSIGAANGTVIGDITTNGYAILVYSGADISGMTLDGLDPAKLRTTDAYINDVLYMRFVASAGNASITEAMLATPDYDLPGYDGASVLKTLKGWGLDGTDPKVGAPATISAELKKHLYTIMVSPIKGMSIVIDGITYSGTKDAELVFGEHTISYRMDPGYKEASEIVLSFNGVAVKDKFTIFPGIDESDLKITAAGTIVIDQNIPEQTKQDDSIIIILLAILVVMVVILAIVTILRMMRS